MLNFTHLVIEGRSKHSISIKPYLDSHEILDIVEGFSHLSFNYNIFPPIKIKMKPMIFVLKKSVNEKFKLFGTTTIRLPQKKKQVK